MRSTSARGTPSTRLVRRTHVGRRRGRIPDVPGDPRAGVVAARQLGRVGSTRVRAHPPGARRGHCSGRVRHRARRTRAVHRAGVPPAPPRAEATERTSAHVIRPPAVDARRGDGRSVTRTRPHGPQSGAALNGSARGDSPEQPPRAVGTVAALAPAAGTELRSPRHGRRVSELGVTRPRPTGVTSASFARGVKVGHAEAIDGLLAQAVEGVGVVDGAALRRPRADSVRSGGSALGVTLLLTLRSELWLRGRDRRPRPFGYARPRPAAFPCGAASAGTPHAPTPALGAGAGATARAPLAPWLCRPVPRRDA